MHEFMILFACAQNPPSNAHTEVSSKAKIYLLSVEYKKTAMIQSLWHHHEVWDGRSSINYIGLCWFEQKYYKLSKRFV